MALGLIGSTGPSSGIGLIDPNTGLPWGQQPPQASPTSPQVSIMPVARPVNDIQLNPFAPSQTWGEPNPNDYGLQPTDPNTLEGYSMWKKMAQSKGPTSFGKEALAQNEASKQRLLTSSGLQAMGGLNQARSGLASRGGLSSGQSARLADASSDQAILARQGAYRGAKGNILDILKSDEALKREAGDRWAQAEGTFAQQQQDAALRRYQLDLAKWAAGINSEAFRTLAR